MEGEFHITVNAQAARSVRFVFDANIEDLNRIFFIFLTRDEKRLTGRNALICAFKCAVAHAVAAGILRLVQRESHGLPGERPEPARFVVTQIDIVSRPIHRHTVGAEARDAMILRRIQPAVAACIMGNHRTHALRTQIIGERNRNVRSVDHIFASCIVKITVSHRLILPSTQRRS